MFVFYFLIMINDILSAIPLGIIFAFFIGPVFFVLIETSIVKGVRAAIVFDLGVILGDIVFILIAYFSSYQLLNKIKDDPSLFIFGGIVMLTYGIISLIRDNKAKKKIIEIDDEEIKKNNYLGLFIKGFFLNFINIGVLGTWLLIIISVGPQLDMDKTRIFVFFTSIILVYFIIDIAKILLAKQLQNKLTVSRVFLIKRVISIILIISGILLLSQCWFPKNNNMINKALEKTKNI
jgi:threonine/homoserine/homoserine lactone efflux protein